MGASLTAVPTIVTCMMLPLMDDSVSIPMIAFAPRDAASRTIFIVARSRAFRSMSVVSASSLSTIDGEGAASSKRASTWLEMPALNKLSPTTRPT